MGDSPLASAPVDLQAIAARSQLRLRVPETLASVERDIRRNVRASYRPPVARDFENLVRALLEHVIDNLKALPLSPSRPFTSSSELEELERLGEELLDQIDLYLILAEHYYGDSGQALRPKRVLHTVSAETDALSAKAGPLKADVVKYMRRITAFLENAVM